MKKILVVMGRYLPGYKDGGPVRSIKNLVDCLGEEYEFRILTCDRDHEDKYSYPGIRVNEWNVEGKAKVFYVPPGKFTFGIIKRLAEEVDLVYLCGCFRDYSIKALLLKKVGKIRKTVVVAAMGLFSPLEFQRKYKKKKLFITICNLFGIFQGIYWSATSELEVEEICQQVKVKREQFFLAEDLPRMIEHTPVKKEKTKGKLRVVWISRITPKKNLLQCIHILSNVISEIEFTVYGSIHDTDYWEACKKELKRLPENIKWSWGGTVESEQVVQVLKDYHVFLFPTLGENYGHVIMESLAAGCAVILSDQTPWKDFEEKGCGYVFPLDDTEAYIKAVERYASMTQKEMQETADQALQYVWENSKKSIEHTGYRKIFEELS